MIVKIHSRGGGSGSGPVDYLLGKDRLRDDARVLRGNAERTRELIDGCDFSRAYTSGVLSFQEADIAEPEKVRLMDEWEQTLMTGLDKDQYDCLWVEHQDKGRLELNFVFPNIELQSGKRLQPYFDRADRPRVNAWQTLTNDRLGLRDPNDPAHRRPLTQASDLPRDKQQAAEKLTAGLMNLMAQGAIRSRQDVVAQIESIGLTVARETKSSISIADPSGGRNIRLKGMIYERDFQFGAGLRGEIEAASAGYRTEREARVREAGSVYHRGLDIKRADHQQRHPRAEYSAEWFASGDGYPRPVMDMDMRHAADVPAGRDNLVSGANHSDSAERHRRLQPSTGRPESPDRRGGQDIWQQPAAERLPRGVSDEGTRGGNLHFDGRKYGGEVHREIAPVARTGTPLSGFDPQDTENHDRTGKTAAERLRELTGQLRTTAAGLAGQLQQFAADVRDYLGGAGPQRQGVRALEQSGEQLAHAGRKLKRERQPLDELIDRHDRAHAQKLRERQALEQEHEQRQKPTRYYGPSM